MLGDPKTSTAVIGLGLSFLLSCIIGAQDVSNSFSTSVGARAITVKQAIVLATICEFAGSLAGGSVSSTIATKLIDLEALANHPEDSAYLYALCMTCTIGGALAFLFLATAMGWPVSTTHAILAGAFVTGLLTTGSADEQGLLGVLASSVASPVLGFLCSFAVFRFVKQSILAPNMHVAETQAAIRLCYGLTAACLVAFATTGLLPILDLGVLGGCGAALVTLSVASTRELHWAGTRCFPCLRPVPVGPQTEASSANGPLSGAAEDADDRSEASQSDTDLMIPRDRSEGSRGMRAKSPGPSASKAAPSAAVSRVGLANDRLRHQRHQQAAWNAGSQVSSASATASGRHRALSSLEKGTAAESSGLLETPTAVLTSARSEGGVQHRGSSPQSPVASDVADPSGVKGREAVFRPLVVLTSCAVSLAHGANDVSSAVGPALGLVVVAFTGEPPAPEPTEEQEGLEPLRPPLWLLAAGGTGIVLGLWLYGTKVMATVGENITQLSLSRAFAAQVSTAATIMVASILGFSVSTTHVLIGAITGVALVDGADRINMSTLKRIALSWVVTLPAAGLVAAALLWTWRRAAP